jgi:signal transduction histidine kinase/DNA-binding response OmpR family regulator
MRFKFNILIVDDLKANLTTLEAIIQANFSKVNIFQAICADDGLKIALTQKIDLIISDIQMPIMDGFEFASLLKYNPKTKDIPIVFITAIYNTNEYQARGYELGVIDYINKPIENNILVGKIKNYIKMDQTVKALENEKKLANGILNGQTNFTILTNGDQIKRVNRALLDFVGFDTLDDFHKKYDCVCDFFIEEEGYLPKQKDDKTWLDIILEDRSIVYQVMMKDQNDNVCIFQVNSNGKVFEEEEEEEEEEEYVIAFTDITELKKEKQSSKHKDIFLANMSHDIRTPLNGIIGFVDILLNNTKPTSEQKKYLDLIKNSSSLLGAIINDILDFSKLAEGKLDLHLQSTNIKSELSKTLSLFANEITNKSLKYSVNIDENISSNIMCDKNRLNQVMINLIGNSIKFTSKGEIRVDISMEKSTNQNISLRFSIKDTGIGISSQKQKEIFAPFTQEDNTTSTNFGGTGLGLSISKYIVELMDGELMLNSIQGEGSEFYFVLNFDTSGKILAEEEEEEEEEESNFDHKHILVAEDNPTNQILIEILLKNKNITSTIASDGMEALEIYKKTNNKFDMVFTDINMPIMGGVEFFENMMEFEKSNNITHTPIIALTANAIVGDKEKFIDMGMDGYLSKPIDKKELEEILKNFLINNTQDEKITYDISKTADFFGIDEDMTLSIIGGFFDTLDTQLTSLDHAIKNDDFETIRQILHSIKGSSGDLKFEHINSLCKILEQDAKENIKTKQLVSVVEVLSIYTKQYKTILNIKG